MSAETLRRAAALMRSRAEKATPGVWRVIGGGEYVAPVGIFVAPDDGGVTSGDAAHIASWHPAVALAVAHFLAAEAAHAERGGVDWNDPDTVSRNALTVARAYLGETDDAA